MIKIKTIWLILLFLITLIIGIFAGKLFSIPYFEIDPKINVLHAISILTPIFVAVVVGVILDQHKESNKIKRDLVLSRIDELYTTVNELHEILDPPTNISLTDINKKLKAIGTHGLSIKSIIMAANYKESSHVNAYTETHKALKNKLTMTDITAHEEGNTPDISVADGKCVYSTARILEIESDINDLRKHIFYMQVEIASS